MSNIPIKDAADATRKVDVFVRTEGSDQVEMQAIALVDPTTGNPARPTADGDMPVALNAVALAALQACQPLALQPVQDVALEAAVGAPADVAATDDAGTFSLIALFKRALGSLTSLLGRTPALATTVPSNTAPGVPVRPIGLDMTRAGFTRASASGLLSTQMAVMGTIGTGMSISQSGGNLVIGSGTTASSDVLLRSSKAWQGSWLATLRFMASQRIANSSFMFLMADIVAENVSATIVNSTTVSVPLPTGHGLSADNVGQSLFVGGANLAGCTGQKATIAAVVGDTLTVTVAGWPASGTTNLSLFGRHHAKVLYNGTTVTAAQYATQNGGWGNADTAITTLTSNSPGHMVELHQAGLENYVMDTLAASTTTPNVALRGTSLENTPDDNTDLYLILWAFNAASAPTATTYTVGFWSVKRFANQSMYIEGVRPQGGQPPLPVAFQATPAVNATVTGDTAAAASADGLTNPTVKQIGAANLAFNGTTWDRVRGNWNTTTGDTGAKTVTFNGATQTNFNARGALIAFNVGAVTGTTPTMAAKVQMSPDGGTTWIDVPNAVTPTITATGVYTLLVHPEIPAAANTVVQYPLLRTWRVVYTIGGTTPSFTLTNVQVAYVN